MRYLFHPSLSLVLAMFIPGSLCAESTSTISRYKAELEVLHGITVEPETVSIDVRSSGCTQESNFKWIVKTIQMNGEVKVAVIRIVPDFCRANEHNVTLAFKSREIGLSKVDTFSVMDQFRGSQDSDLLKNYVARENHILHIAKVV